MNLPCREKSGIADPLQTEAFCIDGSNNALSRIMMQFYRFRKRRAVARVQTPRQTNIYCSCRTCADTQTDKHLL